MKIKFNQYERVAGLFVLTAVVGSLASMVVVAVSKGWFEPKVKFATSLKNAEGIREGTIVQMAGLRAGAVTQVELRENNEIFVKLEIAQKFHDRVREDSVIRALRPFVIGEKVLDVTVGSDASVKLAAGANIRSEATMDVMDLVSGKSLGPYLETIGKMTENLKHVAEAITDPERSRALVRMVDELSPLVKNANALTKEAVVIVRDVNKDKRIARLASNLDAMTTEITKLMPAMMKDSPELAQDMKKIAKNVAVLTDELQKTLPLLQELGPEVPRASKRAMEALDETVVTLKALQKSFLLRGNVKDVRQEEAERERAPASENKKD